MRQWCLSSKNPKTSSWPPSMRTMWVLLQVRNKLTPFLTSVSPSLYSKASSPPCPTVGAAFLHLAAQAKGRPTLTPKILSDLGRIELVQCCTAVLVALRLGICEGVSCYQEPRDNTQSWVPQQMFVVVCGFLCSRALPPLL